eukprot:6569664-Pyramimonas_sp.AAC.1
MKDNFYKACKADGCVEWYAEQRKDPNLWKKLKRWYKTNCAGADRAAKPRTFCPTTYKTAVRVEQQQLRDGIKEMMHEVAFKHWASKPKNWPPRGLNDTEAAAEFRRRCELPDEI